MQFSEQQIREAFPRDPWPHQLRGVVDLFKKLETVNSVVMAAPTAAGKTLMQTAIVNLVQEDGIILYNFRRGLTDQTCRVLENSDIHFGVRSAAHKQMLNLHAKVQAASIQTDIARIIQQGVWQIHNCKYVVIDEAHLETGVKLAALMQMYLAAGAKVIGFTGTPIGLSVLYKDIVVAGTNSELRACGAHVPARMFSVHELDCHRIKPTKTGEFSEGDIRRECWNQAIVGYIVRDYKRLNPDRRPAMAAAPGIGESVWLSEQFMAEGLRVVHMDCKEVIIDGERYKNDPEGIVRSQALDDFRAGRVDVLTNCEVIQQGIDLPNLYHLILARPYGSLANVVQTYGRAIRKSPETPDHVIVQDHGGNFIRHGSPNEDRDWAGLFQKTEKEIREESIAKKQEAEREPIVCGGCGMVRAEGNRCPACGYISDKTKRIIVQQDGQLIEYTGREYKKREPRPEPTASDLAQKQWDGIYFNALRNGKDTSFKALKAQYKWKYKQEAPNTLKNMPVDIEMFKEKVSKVPQEALR